MESMRVVFEVMLIDKDLQKAPLYRWSECPSHPLVGSQAYTFPHKAQAGCHGPSIDSVHCFHTETPLY